MEFPSVPFSKDGETNQSVKMVLKLFSQGHRASQLITNDRAKKAIIAALTEGKRAVDGYYSTVSRGTRSEGISAELKERLSQLEASISKKQTEDARLQAAFVTQKSRMSLAQTNADKYRHVCRAAELELRQMKTENAEMTKQVAEGKEEWTKLVANAQMLHGRFNRLIEQSPTLNASHKVKDVIVVLLEKCAILEEERVQLERRKEYLMSQTSATEGNFDKFIKSVAKFIMREKFNLQNIKKNRDEMDRLQEVYEERRANAARGHNGLLDASFADFDDTIAVTLPEETQTPGKSRKVVRFKDVSLERQESSLDQEEPAQAPVETNTLPSSPSTISSTSHSPVLPPKPQAAAPTTMAAAAATPRTLKAAAPPAATNPPRMSSPVKVQEPPARRISPQITAEPIEQHQVEQVTDVVMETSYNEPEEQVPMDTDTNGGDVLQNPDDGNFTFSQFGQPSGVDGGMSTLFDPSQDATGGGLSAFDTDAVLNISTHSNDPGGDFLKMMQSDGKQPEEAAKSPPGDTNFSFGMFGGDGDSNDGPAGDTDFNFDFNGGGGGSNDAPESSFNFNFGGGDSDPAPSGGDGGGGFFFAF